MLKLRFGTLSVLLLFPVLAFSYGHNSENNKQPASIIYDTDIGDDVDDAMALALIHSLVSRGDAELLAVTISKPNFYAAAYCDLVNTFYGRGDIPIGLARSGQLKGSGPYLEKLATAVDLGKLRYPRDVYKEENVPEATSLLRQVLSKKENNSVIIVQVGYASNMARLLESHPDEFSPLSGKELVKQKVKFLSVMSGYFGTEKTGFAEHNVRIDIDAARKIVNEWPSPIVFSGWEVGRSILYPADSIQNNFSYVEHHPIREAYELWSQMPYDRPTYDLTSVLYAVFPESSLFELSEPGLVSFENNGVTRFTPVHDGLHKYLFVNEEQRRRILNIFLELVPQHDLLQN